MHWTYVSGIERGGRNITLKCLEKLAGALKVSTADLLTPPAESVFAVGGSPSQGGTAASLVEILLVDDNSDDVEMTFEAFRQAGITNRVHVVRDGAEALDFLFCTGDYAYRTRETLPLMILLDLTLPKVSGLEVLRRVKQDSRTRMVPVIVLTVSKTNQDIIESRRLGAETYIVKPVDFQNFSLVTPQLQLDWGLLRPATSVRAGL